MKPAENSISGNSNMIFFMKMPTGSIYINYCDDQNINKVMNNFRSKYEPNFIPKIAEMSGTFRDCEEIYKKFSDYRISTKSHQYAPSNSLIDFINTKRVLHKQPYHASCESVRAFDSSDGTEHVEIMMTQNMQNALMLEGSSQSVSPCDLVREVMTFFLAIKIAKRFGEDIEPQIAKFNEYLRK